MCVCVCVHLCSYLLDQAFCRQVEKKSEIWEAGLRRVNRQREIKAIDYFVKRKNSRLYVFSHPSYRSFLFPPCIPHVSCCVCVCAYVCVCVCVSERPSLPTGMPFLHDNVYISFTPPHTHTHTQCLSRLSVLWCSMMRRTPSRLKHTIKMLRHVTRLIKTN